MKLDRYRTIAGEAVAKLTRKGSRFIAFAYPVRSLKEVKDHLNRIKRRYHDATHHCYAYRLIAEGGIVVHADDAGEPVRSAGPPILQVIEGEDLLNILVIVVRYFGGTKLGIGGLIRAYGDAAKEALAQAEVVERVKMEKLRIRYPPELFGEVMRLVNQYRVEVEGIAYSDQPVLIATLPLSQSEEFRRALQEITSGRVEFLQDQE
jgi:uncharacterized YigZ family protein